ncbi:hypothetical protein SAMD00019534_079970 [Acytostelium subglobosum LB1]|uniref:hypothetical protein n=1 Tax=Acytostelium subglobosum LB1 TaxID=1410327 RepID=UPI000644CF4F|nr:hypothetical protein SAMD00019534_079970 [Acytostelium subglobosum LB1]GAM24822.1 hypothetical protein SAMD00019534_079970 [Acytostelium subglobosum LB1]|eukprot:XP_012752491.1 hypothetical protein SAMD00019534_079970 [Acytostelium subglobosum LB1]
MDFVSGSTNGKEYLEQMFKASQQEQSTVSKLASVLNRYPKQHKPFLIAQLQQQGLSKCEITKTGIAVSKHQWQRACQLVSGAANKAMLPFWSGNKRTRVSNAKACVIDFFNKKLVEDGHCFPSAHQTSVLKRVSKSCATQQSVTTMNYYVTMKELFALYQVESIANANRFMPIKSILSLLHLN